jgi:SEC-C motif-containing protein
MRSRYCAYALERVDYLIQTTHPEGPHWQPDRARWRASLRDWCRATRFLGLELLAVDEALPQEEASVTFRATLSQGAQDISFTERSRFRRHEGRWKYLMAMETQ